MTALHTNLNWTLAMNDTARILAKQKYLGMFEYHGTVVAWIYKHPQVLFPEAAIILESLLREHDSETTVFMTSGAEGRFNLCEDLEREIIDIIAKEEFDDVP